jgi:hypothetical protein
MSAFRWRVSSLEIDAKIMPYILSACLAQNVAPDKATDRLGMMLTLALHINSSHGSNTIIAGNYLLMFMCCLQKSILALDTVHSSSFKAGGGVR